VTGKVAFRFEERGCRRLDPDRAAGSSPEARRRLTHARSDEDLASVCGEALAELPEPERAARLALWDSVERALE